MIASGGSSAERLLRAHRAGFSRLSQRQLEQLIAMDPSREVPDMDPSVCLLYTSPSPRDRG